MKTSCTI